MLFNKMEEDKFNLEWKNNKNITQLRKSNYFPFNSLVESIEQLSKLLTNSIIQKKSKLISSFSCENNEYLMKIKLKGLNIKVSIISLNSKCIGTANNIIQTIEYLFSNEK